MPRAKEISSLAMLVIYATGSPTLD